MILETQGLVCDFGALRALDGVALAVPDGQVQAIIGPNGAGKTTLLNIISGRLRPTRGRVCFRGEEITGLPPYALSRRGLARTFQITNILPNLTTLENLRIAVQSRRRFHSPFVPASRLRDVEERARAVLAEVQLAHQAETLAGNLSHGEQRHLEIGVALATQPDLLLLDEPTAGMSPEETRATVGFLRGLAGRVTMMIVEHDMEVVMTLAERITVLHNGRILADGTPEAVRANADVQRVYLRGL